MTRFLWRLRTGGRVCPDGFWFRLFNFGLTVYREGVNTPYSRRCGLVKAYRVLGWIITPLPARRVNR